MSQSQFARKVVCADGTMWDTEKEAKDHLRMPKIKAALEVLTKNNSGMVEWIMKNQEAIESSFETGTIKRVTKAEFKKLENALKAIVEAADPKAQFVIDNAAAIQDSFRWPAVKRLTAEEKDSAVKLTLVKLTIDEATGESNDKLADWLLANKDAMLECFQAGVEKREVSAKATEGLAAYREKKAAEKAAKLAAEAESANQAA
jgi:hypothetical protein